jgi:uncharacterized protein YwgA
MEVIGMSNPTDLALLVMALGEARGPINGRKRLQKTVCLLKYHDKIPFSFGFKPYFYGPFSEQLAEAIEVLESSNIVNEEPTLLSNEIVQYNYELTKSGKKLHKKLARQNEELTSDLAKALETITKLPTSELVRLSKRFIKPSKPS